MYKEGIAKRKTSMPEAMCMTNYRAMMQYDSEASVVRCAASELTD